MPSTYTPNLRLELQASGENRSTWGIKANNDFSLIETAITGYASIAMGDANITLTANNAASDQARNATLRFTGANTAIRTVTIPSVPKIYLIKNATTGGFAITIKTAAGTGSNVTNGSVRAVYCDGTDVFAVSNYIAAARLVGRASTAGEAEEIPLGFGLQFTAGALEVNSTQIDIVPVGARVEMTGRTVPTGYLSEDGAAYSRTTYADLFNYYQTGFTAQTGMTIAIGSNAILTKTAHALWGGARVRLSTTGALPTGLNTSTDYFVTPIDANQFRVSTTQANYENGVYVTTSGSQSGTQGYLQSLYGLGDGTTTFNVADRRGKFSVAADITVRGIGSELPSVNKTHTHSVSDPGHAHGVGDPGHSHILIGGQTGNGQGIVSLRDGVNNLNYNTAGSGTGIWIGAAGTGISLGSNGAAEGYPRHLAILSCVKY